MTRRDIAVGSAAVAFGVAIAVALYVITGLFR